MWKNMPFFVEYVVNFVAEPLLLLVGAMAAIAALHALQRERYGLPGALASLAPFVGLALVVSSFILHMSNQIIQSPGFIVLVGVGALLMTLGVVALGIITIAARVLPWWCGAALIVGSLLFVLLVVGFALGLFRAGPFGDVALMPIIVAWALVGYAIFRAGGRVSEQPSRVQ